MKIAATNNDKDKRKPLLWVSVFVISLLSFVFVIAPYTIGSVSYQKGKLPEKSFTANVLDVIDPVKKDTSQVAPLDTEDYDRRMQILANNPPQPKDTVKKIKNKDGTFSEQIIPATPRIDKWPVKTAYPKAGALLPFNRIVAYYGNLYSKKMGVLGEYPEDIMLAKLEGEVKKWEIADPETSVIPALHYIAVVAQGSAGADGKYRFRMPDKEIDKVLAMAEKINAIVFIDIQVALSNVQTEVPYFEKYLKMPNVHLGIDPEFAMHNGKKPGTVIGTLDASDINFATEYLAKLVKENNLPPKVLMVHRFTQGMVTNYKNIKTMPEVQIVIDMDGWGPQANKITTYKQFVFKEPVQFTGFKLFYKNDIKAKDARMLTPAELLKLNPRPIYIQYQ